MSKKKKTVEELLEEALVPEEEQPYGVPKNWMWVNSGYILNFIGGGTPSKRNVDYWNGEIPWATVKDIKDRYLSSTIDYITVKGLENSSATMASPNELLLITRMSPGKSTITRISTSINQDLKIVRPKIRILPYFLWLFFTVNTPLIESISTGSTVKGIQIEKLKKIPFPVPPLNEQKRIAEKVERLLSKIEEAKRLIEEAKETFELRRAAILDKAFRGELTRKWREENPVIENAEVLYDKITSLIKPKKLEIFEGKSEDIPCKWKWVRLGEVVQVNPPKKKLSDVSEDQKCTFIPMPAVSDKTGRIEQPEEREYGKVKKGYTFFLENDVLFAKITPCMENGKSAIARQLKNGFGYGSTEFHVLRTSEYVNEQYIHYLVRSQRFRAEAKREMTGAVGQQRVPKEFLLNYPFPLPPREEQDAIVNILDDIFAKDDYSKFNLQIESKLELLKQSILSKAFRGELGTNDSSEESAIELLKEVLQEQVK
ncbi:restriction endonuclease subunit S [Bacillus xiapuensis]|uniref:restriction endonuclease subunit S n=1 Tax=Bacillus xiapuensis TaxID=2014075 RepID=UPI000C234149|nr:restriction endonuclease subunit S [Bacillus xiapuensis]